MSNFDNHTFENNYMDNYSYWFDSEVDFDFILDEIEPESSNFEVNHDCFDKFDWIGLKKYLDNTTDM
jgi:hypothetical protein